MSSGSLRIGSVFGIDVNLHWSFIFLMLIPLVFGLYLFFVILVLLFLCVFIHELAHSVTSLRNGIRVKEIVLLPIGGASMIDQITMDPRIEFNIAIAGPLMSFFLGGIFGIASTLTPPGILTFLAQNLFVLNVALAVLNILPAFPLDGGRVFRSYLEKRRKSEYRATMTTVRASKIMAAIFIIGSLVYLSLINASLEYKELDFFIYAIVALFLYGGAENERQLVIMKEKTKGMTIEEVLNHDYMLVDKSTTLGRIYELMKKRRKHIVIMKDREQFMLVDLFRKRLAKAEKAVELAVEVPQLQYNANIMDAMSRLEGNDYGLGVAIKSGRIAGLVTIQHIRAFVSLHLISKEGKGI